jgi:TonB-linked SusC/RagA family outer membrane protein
MRNTNRVLAAVSFLIILFPLISLAQRTQTISGRVFSKVDQSAIAGASILIKGTKTGATSGIDGNFYIKVKPGDVLEISGVGVTSEEYSVKAGDSYLSIGVTQDPKNLNEVVVTALGVKKEFKKLGYATQTVQGDELTKARDQNPMTGLVGKVSGLSVGPSAELLGTPTLILRGNQINLIVVDGVPISSDTWNISPDDVETYTILKGPTAAALYGSRAQYGAILITTKKGNRARNKGWTVEFNSTNSFDKGFIAFPRTQEQYGGGENELYAFGDGKGGGLNDNDYDVWGPKLNGQLIPQYNGAYDPNTTYTTTFPGGFVWKGHIQPTPYKAVGTHNLDNFLQTGFQTTNNIAMSAAGDNYNVRFSISQSYQQSIIPNNYLNITNFNMFGSFSPSKKVRIDASLNFNRQYTPNYPDVQYGPNSLIYNMSVWTGADWDVNAPDIKAIWQPGKTGTQSMFAEYQRYHNPWFMVYNWLRGHHKTDIYGYISANIILNKNLNLNVRTQATGYDLLRTEKMPFSAHPYGREQNLGDYREDHRSLFENNSDVQLNFNYPVGNFVKLSGLVGGSMRNFSYSSNWTSTDYLNVPEVYSFSNSRNPVQASSFSSDMRVLSGYFSLDAALGKYANITVTGRVDQSSALPQNHDSYFYPSVSVASVLSDYVKLPDFISFLKLRASFAAVHGDATQPTVGPAPYSSITAFGNSGAGVSGTSLYNYPLDYGSAYLSPYGGPDYSLIPVYSTNKPYNNQPAAYSTPNIYDPNIKTFNRVNYEGGFDAKFINNRLGLSATFFEYQDGPQILQNPISTATGFTNYYLNALKTTKTGWEFTVSGTPIANPNNGLVWNVTLNWATYQDKYAELPPGQSTYKTYFHVGDRVDAFYSSAFVKTTDGQIIHDDAGKPLANPQNQLLGFENPDYIWGIYNSISYGHFTLGFQFDGSVGGVTSDYMHNKTMRGGNNIETVEGALGKARQDDNDHAGDISNNPFPGSYVGQGVVVSNGVPINFDQFGKITNYKDLQFAPNTTPTHVQDYVSKYYNVSESNMMSKTFAKLREVTITYNFPSKMLAKTFINSASISLVGRNLIYFYGDNRFKDVDLDQYNYATDGTGLQSPTTRRYGVNINIVF